VRSISVTIALAYSLNVASKRSATTSAYVVKLEELIT
jgi:hypothetical protein